MNESASISSNAFLFERPFGRASDIVMDAWWAANVAFANADPVVWHSFGFVKKINSAFSKLGSLPTQNDPHLTEGLYGSPRTIVKSKTEVAITRPYLLLLEHFKTPIVASSLGTGEPASRDRHNRPKQYLYSPFYLLRQLLTVPDNQATDAYAHAVVRAEIFKCAIEFSEKYHKKRRIEAGSESAISQVREMIDFSNISRSLQKAESYKRNNDTFYPADPSDFIVGQLLASRGNALLTFAPGRQKYKSARKHERPMIGRDDFLAEKSIVPRNGLYEFRFIRDLAHLPSATELLNELDGIPLAIPGLDVILARGLRTTEQRGVVGRISGAAGSGKTSLALAFATALAPLGITTRYISSEEDPADLRKRLVTLAPTFVTRTTSYSDDLAEWFHAIHLDANDPHENMLNASAIVDDMLSIYADAKVSIVADSPPGLSPLLVVIDGVHELLLKDGRAANGYAESLHELVESYRRLGAIVIILSADSDYSALRDLDFIVDFVIKLDQTINTNNGLDTTRRLILDKTRLQFSRTGSHLLHISKRDGVRVYPSLAAQLEMFSHINWRSPNKGLWFDFLHRAVDRKGTADTTPLVKIYEASQVLLTGKGSGGKAGFALKLLTKALIGDADAPELFQKRRPERNAHPESVAFREKRRILIVSFLYGKDYYSELLETVTKTADADSSTPLPDVAIDVLSLYPGFLNPEVLVSKIIRRINRYSYEGEKITAVLIDGLHNVFLQYPLLQDSPMIWPVLFEIFRTLGLTVIVTHTRFEVRGMESDLALRWDVEAATRRVGPLLQSLVNSSDFYLDLSPEIDADGGRLSHRIELVSALGQDVRPSNYFWHRSAGYIMRGQFRAVR